MWRAEAGIPSSVGGGGGYFPNATALLRRILRLTFQHAALSSDITNEWNSTQRLVSVWIHDNGGSGWTNWETAEKFTQNGDNKKKEAAWLVLCYVWNDLGDHINMRTAVLFLRNQDSDMPKHPNRRYCRSPGSKKLHPTCDKVIRPGVYVGLGRLGSCLGR